MMVHRRLAQSRGAFTLVELLVVISIMGLLVGLVVGASTVVIQKQRANLSRNIIIALDRALEEYLSTNNNINPAYIRDYYDLVPGPDNELVEDTRRYAQHLVQEDADVQRHSHRPDTSVFIRQASGQGEVDSIIAEIPTRFLVRTVSEPSDSSMEDIRDIAPSVVDSWADEDWVVQGERTMQWPAHRQSLIYYVHPENYLAQAIYGECLNNRPYFVSAGPDRRYGHPAELELDGFSGEDAQKQEQLKEWRQDNIYSAPIDIDFDIRPVVMNNSNLEVVEP